MADRDGRSTRWDPHRRERRAHIISAAIAAIEEHGSDALTAQIAERAGVPRTHVYRHFDGKPALDLAVSNQVSALLGNQIRAGLTVQGSPRQVVYALIDPFLAWIETNPNLYRFLAKHAFAVTDRDRGAGDAKTVLAEELTLACAAYLSALGAPSAPLGRVVAGLVGLVDTSATWWLEHGGESREDLATALTSEVVLILSRAARNYGVELDPDAPLPPLMFG